MNMSFIPNGMGFTDVDLMIRGIIETCRHHNIKITPDYKNKYVKNLGPIFVFASVDDMVMARFVF